MILNPILVFFFWCVGVSRTGRVGSAGLWWWWEFLLSIDKILTFAFRYLGISGISCYSCLWLEPVSPVILLSEYSLQASSPLAGNAHRSLVFRPASWLKMKAQNRACPRRWVASAVCTLTCTDWSLRDPRHKMFPSPALEVRALPGDDLSSGG